jgi:imidazole glycerol-phosphate synthase subunit HisH
MISVVDSGFGNVGSIINMMRHLGIEAQTVSDPDAIRDADRLILPGVGSFDNGMTRLAERGLIPALNHAVLERKRPILGICLGMQLLLESSDEGSLEGLGWIKGRCKRFKSDGEHERLRIPNMGWNEITLARKGKLFPGDREPARYYFVHSYHAHCADSNDVAATATYGTRFTAAIEHGNILGVQFHPEKSHRFGMKIFESFAKVSGP